MRVEVRFTVPEAEVGDLAGATVVVVDVIRATTTMATALANGARAVYPVASSEEAIRLAQSLGREDTLLCGERRGLRIEGYDLGNSPAEYTREVVEGKRLVMNTTNGTRAFLATEAAARVVAGAFTNLGAVAETVAGAEHLVVVCAGREDVFALEDALMAGKLLQRLDGAGVELELDDGARAALELARAFQVTPQVLASTGAGQLLLEAELGEDLTRCARVDACPVVPVMEDRGLTLMNAPEA